jgi:hypothetical protein
MAALEVLAGGLPTHAQSACDLRPSDAEADGVLHERRQLGLRLLLHDPDARDSLQQLLRGHLGNTRRRACSLCLWGLALLILLRLPRFRARLTLPPWHAVQRARPDATIQVVQASIGASTPLAG